MSRTGNFDKLVGIQDGTATAENTWRFQNVQRRLTSQPSKSTPGGMKEMKLLLRTNTCVQTSIAAYALVKG